eukprot:CAMPEP_0176375994 /NCGR_PEP_ID=MMETSP0126-20121128/27885_1 /TAXON_ID=141414 ORGANISM="Strombidinopsis acuminatum, Strain SPMC142" /NCGR_SAMPLE_ID=MMETSP0126 /ASSEMBLY_ACC=CAM_ASM_000229 /LENGTH=125 /DNA_ID=CAMNT_0017737269 /DNA_START=828 /DNA_END=1205 /DNA_ORIENTATION=+
MNNSVSMAFTAMDFLTNMILVASYIGIHCVKLSIMPPFQPNEYLFEKFRKSTSQPDWEVFAWAVRDAMAKSSGLEVSDQPLREMVAYDKFMTKRTPSVQFGDKTFIATEESSKIDGDDNYKNAGI